MGVTIRDVAEKSGVTPSTVSRVIHGNPKISGKTKLRVQKAMDELGYHPHAAARSLAKGKTRTLGLIIPNSRENLFVKPFFILAMRGLSIEAQKQGYNIMFSFTDNGAEEVRNLQQFVRQNAVDGVILMTAREEDKSMAFLESIDFPYVVIGRPSGLYEKALWVDNDNRKAMFDMVRYFQRKGKRKIAFLGGPAKFRVTQNRLEGYKEAFFGKAYKEEDLLISLCSGFGEEEGLAGMEKLLNSAVLPDAIVAADDFLAFGAMRCMEEKRLDIPLSGFNNTMKGEIHFPSLTTVDIQSEKLGERAANLLISHLENPEELEGHIIVDTLLIERESSNAHAAGDSF